MRYTLLFTETASADVVEAFEHIQRDSPQNAERWIRQLYRTIHALESFAEYAVAREAEFLGVDLRQRIFKSHRIVFSVDEALKTVTVHYVRHAARRAVGEPEGEDDDE